MSNLFPAQFTSMMLHQNQREKTTKFPRLQKKRSRQKTYENCSEPKRLHIYDEDISLLLNILTSPSENGKDSKDGSVSTILHDHLSHDVVSMKSKPNLSPSEKQTDQLVINELPNTSDDKSVDSSSCKQADNANKKVETTSDQCVNQIVSLLEGIEQDYSPTLVEPSIPNTCSTTDHPSDLSIKLPEYVELCINTYQNSYNPNETLKMDIEKFIKEQDMDFKHKSSK